MKPSARKLLLTAHVVTSVGWLGVDLVQLSLGLAGLNGWRPEVVYPAVGLIGELLFVPLSVLVWVIGVLSAVVTPWGLLRHWWVAVKLLLTTVMLGLVLFLLRPNLTAAAELGATLGGRERLDVVMAAGVSSTLLIAATALSTYKPWGRIRGRMRAWQTART